MAVSLQFHGAVQCLVSGCIVPSSIHVLYINNNEYYTCGLGLGYFETTFSNFLDESSCSASSVLKGTDDFNHEKRKGILQK